MAQSAIRKHGDNVRKGREMRKVVGVFLKEVLLRSQIIRD